jgi:predicted N-acetyltransferase YhbS
VFKSMRLSFRPAKPDDFETTEHLTRDAFWDVYKPGADEHLVLHKLRESESYIEDLDLVALEGERIIGHIICTRAKVIDEKNEEHPVLCAGPFSILTELQGKGYGSSLMEHCIKKGAELGYAGMVLFGNPGYYHRFGFRNAAVFGITTKEGMNFEPFMALELQKEGLKGVRGRFFEDGSFSVDKEELEEFEKRFPRREKHVTPTQLKL